MMVAFCTASRTSPSRSTLRAGGITHLGDHLTISICRQAGTAQMVTKQVFHFHPLWADVFPHRNTGCACEVIFGYHLSAARVGHFVMCPNEEDRLTAHLRFDAPANIISLSDVLVFSLFCSLVSKISLCYMELIAQKIILH